MVRIWLCLLLSTNIGLTSFGFLVVVFLFTYAGGGYSMIQKHGRNGLYPVLVAGGGE